jgi:hypothetical protein
LGSQVDSIYLDFCKAFDSVVHSKLIYKLKQYGFSGKLLLWLECFLSDRYQCVKIENQLSSWSRVISGVPQGSVLGPILFVIFVNDLPLVCANSNSSLYLYADDGKCFAVIKTLQDCEYLQSTLDAISSWSEQWQLPLSLEKCNVVSFHTSCTPITYNYSLSGHILDRQAAVKDLGILFTSNLNFSKHISNLCNAARSRAAIIFRCFRSRDCHLLYKAFVTYVRPILEYCSSVWSPYCLKDTRKIEAVQKTFTKRLNGLRDLSYGQRLLALSADTLECRRIKSDLKMYYSIIHNLVDIPSSSLFSFKVSNTRGNGLTLVKQKFSNNLNRYVFKIRLINLWNLLPDIVVNSPSLNCFSVHLDSVNLGELTKKANMNTN